MFSLEISYSQVYSLPANLENQQMQNKEPIKEIDPRDAYEHINRGEPALLIDVRNLDEFQQSHAAGAENMPLPKLDTNEVVKIAQGRTVFMICQKGGRSMRACQQVVAYVSGPIFNVRGGTDAWIAAGLPVEK